MTTTDKPVKRVSRDAYEVLYQGNSNARPIVARLGPGDVVWFKELGRRQWWPLAFHSGFLQAVRNEVARQRAERRKAK